MLYREVFFGCMYVNLYLLIFFYGDLCMILIFFCNWKLVELVFVVNYFGIVGYKCFFFLLFSYFYLYLYIIDVFFVDGVFFVCEWYLNCY